MSIEYTRKFDGGGNGREFVQFSEDAIQNPAKSEQAGRPIFDQIEMISISFPGNNLTEIVRKVTDEDRERYKAQYEAFKRHGGTIVEGTPLEAWTALSKAQVREFNAMKIFTVEQLAGISDLAKQTIGMGGHMWAQRAQVFLEASEDNAVVDRIAGENQRLKEQVATLSQQVAELGGMCQTLQHQIQGAQNARPDAGMPVAPISYDAVRPMPVSPELAAGSLGEPQAGYVEPKRRGPGRPKAEAA